MDAKDLRIESTVSERNNDGSKYSQSGGITLHCDRNKSYQDIGSNSLGKVDVPNTRPCAVIGPDRVVPPPAASEAYHIKKGPADPWPCMENAYRRPPEYPHKLSNFQNPSRNISPRQTFQENMQRIMVPPTYNSIKINDDTNYAQVPDRSLGLSKNIKLNVPQEAKFCDVPYTVNPTNNDPKNVRNPEMCLPSVNPTLTQTAPNGWPPGSVNLRTSRMYSAPELYQYQEYPSCAGPRPVVPRPHRTVQEEQGYVYADPYYQEGNIRFKPYPSVKERYPQQRYGYIGNYSNPFHPPPGFPSHKYELQKSMPAHPYPPYPPIKYLDSRVAEPVMEGYQRNPQGNYNLQYRNQVIHPNYGPVLGTCPQTKLHSYPPDSQVKTIAHNKLPYDNNKAYIEYENNRPKMYQPSESYFINDMSRIPMKSQVIMPNYPTLNMQNIQPNPYYKKDSQQMKNYEHMAHFRNMDPNLNVHNPMARHQPVFSPNTLAISPTDSSTSNDTTQTLGTSQEDCGYVSQSSSASVRSIDSGINRIPNDYLRKYYDNRYGPIVRTSPMMSKSQLNSSNNSKDRKSIDVRQFLQMWNEGDEEAEENSLKDIIVQTSSSEKNQYGKTQAAMNNHEQLYVLGLVNVPSEELAKYEHIQKVSKLPENIKGYNNIELLKQFEEVIESSNMNNYKSPNSKEFQMSIKKGIVSKHLTGAIPPRPVSPLDVEAKISQSVIHKEVGCNFEIKPCSPKMHNVEVAAPVQNIMAERTIEKVVNPVMIKSPILNRMDESVDCNNTMKRPDHRLNMNENIRIPSCKMINTQFSNNNTLEAIKSSYSLQDLESNSGLCLASLPRLDNDIELNFPEVNQQFINANKGDSTVLTTSVRDLPTLDVLDQSENQTQDKLNTLNSPGQDNNNKKSPNIMEPEKEFSKLSKYRKTKTITAEQKEVYTQKIINAVRTDSVIIKNPDNIKNHEENSDFPCNSNSVTDIQQTPINLTSQGNLSSSEPVNMNLHDSEINKQLPVETAIDFSLNKNEIHDSECSKKNNESKIQPLSQIEDNPSNVVISKDDPSVLTVFTHQSEHYNDVSSDNHGENCTPISEKDTECKPLSDAIVDKSNNEIYTDMVKDTHKCASDINIVEVVTKDVCNLILQTNVEIAHDELISDIKSDSCSMEIDNGYEPAADILPKQEVTEEVNYTCSEKNSEISLYHKEDFEKEGYKENTAEKNTTSVVATAEFQENCNNIYCSDATNELVNTILKVTTEVSDFNNTADLMKKEQLTQHIDCNNFLLPNEELCCDDCDQSDSKQSTFDQNSELNPFSSNFINDEHNNLNHNVEVNSRSDLLGEITDHEVQKEKLKHFEEKESEETKINHRKEDLAKFCQVESTTNNVEECVKPVRYLWYGSKEMYSPWIQKLLMFTEGIANNRTMKKEVTDCNDYLLDATKDVSLDEGSCRNVKEDLNVTELLHINEENNVSDDCLLKITNTIPVDVVSSKIDLGKELNNKYTDEDQIIIGTKHYDQLSFDNNMDDAVKLCHHSVYEKNLVNDAKDMHNEDNQLIVNTDNKAAGQLAEIRELHEKTVTNPRLETEPNKNENNDDNFKTSIGSPIINKVTSIVYDQIEDPDTFSTSTVYNNDQCEEPDLISSIGGDVCQSFPDDSEQPKDKNPTSESSNLFENVRYSCKKMHQFEDSNKKCLSLKRSLSDSALNMYNTDEPSKQEKEENIQFAWPFKRRKANNVENHLLNIIHNNRRNSISSIYNEDNVSFCILIDNSCIITEEENEDQEKVCYTELTEDCLTEIHNSCIKNQENEDTLMEAVPKLQLENACEYSDSFALECEEEKTLEESWVDDVACVETVISDDIAEDIEISAALSPRDDVMSDNEESGVFSSSQHTDKVKYIYGEKMCNDDALFVETLYNTPQMDVNKTLFNREAQISEEYDKYYDNNSLEKMLSGSNEQELSPYIPEYMDSIFPSGVENTEEAPENKENVHNKPMSSLQSINNGLDIVVDINVDNFEDENMHSIAIFAKTQDDTIHSCESSIDNVFSYKQKDEDTIFTTSSSPEVSSTTSEEKNSGILLKITNYQGSRISQLNDISRVNKRSSCKFTEDKEYKLQSQNSCPTNRPLLTKAAQKYIPPLKETIRDLKVKLSLPQHSLMKLKQLKLSKEEPKVNKHNSTFSRIPKKVKPKFEDVLKSIDEIQFKMHKEKTKKSKKSIPKVVIKKNLNGSHYASTSNKDYNPDLTGRKWQPWVFIEKNHFIDKMAIKKKTKAIYSHRKKTYVLAEKFQKYKSASSAKFVISPPVSDNPSTGLKYTIRLKHNY